MASSQSHLLGIDIGTSGLKSVLLDLDGRVLASAIAEYSPETPRPNWVEQDPAVWLQATIDSVRQVVKHAGIAPGSIVGIGFSGQMHSTVLLDAAGNPVRPAILWLDTRSAAQVAELWQRYGEDRLAAWIGNPVMTGVTLASLLWLRAQEPDSWKRIAHVILAKDYVRYRLTGDIFTDFSDASATALFDAGERRWSTGLLDATGVPSAWLPPVIASSEIAGYLRPDMAEALGLPAGIPVACGAGDQEAQAVGNGIVRAGLLSCTIGTGGQLFMPADRYRCDPALRLHTFCHAVPDLWHWMAATLTAGMSLRWLRDNVLAGRYSYREMADAAADVEPGAEGLVFLPHLAGERTPHLDPQARGTFYGLTLRHSWQHMVRAVMEGVVFSLLDGLNLMRELGGSARQVVASGGGARHRLWLQLQAEIFGLPIVPSASVEAAAAGGALLGGVAAGLYPDVIAACERAVHWSELVVHSRPEMVARYRVLGQRYRALYPVLAARFREDYG